jgi:hypothetical protein
MTPEERALESAWKICSAWDGKITKPVLRKAIDAALKEAETGEVERLRRMVERRDEFIIANGLWETFKEARRED